MKSDSNCCGTGLPGRLHKYFPFFSIVFLALLLRLFCFVGLGRNDDVAYCDAARILALGDTGLYPWDSILALRTGMVAPIALAYRFFGFSEFTASLYPLLSSLMSVVLAMVLAHHFAGRRAAIIAGAVLASFPLDVAYSTQIVPTVPLAPTLATALYCFIAAIERSSYKWAAAAGLFYGISWLINEQTIVCLPIFAAFAFFRLFYRNETLRHSARFYLITALIVAAFVVAEGFVIHRLTGRPATWRFTVSQELLSTIDTNTSLLYYPRAFFLPFTPSYPSGEGFFGLFCYFFIFSSAVLFYRGERAVYFLIISVVTVVLYLEFGVMSGNLRPIAKWIRYLVMLSPPAVTVVAVAFDRLLAGRKSPWAAAGLLVLVLSNLFYAVNGSRALLDQVEQFKNLYSFLTLRGTNQPVYLGLGVIDYLRTYDDDRLDMRVLGQRGIDTVQNGLVAVESIGERAEQIASDPRALEIARVPQHLEKPDGESWRIFLLRADRQAILSGADLAALKPCSPALVGSSTDSDCQPVQLDSPHEYSCRVLEFPFGYSQAIDIEASAAWQSDKTLGLEMAVEQVPKRDALPRSFLTYYWLIDADGDRQTGRQDGDIGTDVSVRLVKVGRIWQVHSEICSETGCQYLQLNSDFQVADKTVAAYLPLSDIPIKILPTARWNSAATIDPTDAKVTDRCLDQVP